MIELIGILLRWKWPIAIVCVLTAILSIVFSLMKPNYYESYVVFLAANPYLIDRSTLFSEKPGETPLFMFGSSPDIDRLIAIGNTQPLIDYVIEKYNLYDHYKIDKSDPLASYEVNKEFLKHYNIFKNPLDAIEVHVADQDPQLAATIANDIVTKIDVSNIELLASSKTDMANLLDKSIVKLRRKLTSLSDSLAGSKRINSTDVEIIEGLREKTIEDLSRAELVKEQYETLSDKNITSLYILQKAFPSVKKSKPKRSILVLSSILVALIISAGIAIILEQFKAYNRETGSRL